MPKRSKHSKRRTIRRKNSKRSKNSKKSKKSKRRTPKRKSNKKSKRRTPKRKSNKKSKKSKKSKRRTPKRRTVRRLKSPCVGVSVNACTGNPNCEVRTSGSGNKYCAARSRTLGNAEGKRVVYQGPILPPGVANRQLF